MKIVEAKAEGYTWEMGPAQSVGDIPPAKKERGEGLAYIVTILTDEGLEGHCVARPSFRGAWAVSEGVALMQDLLIGEDPLDREKIWQQMMRYERHRSFTINTLGAVDVALWDIGAKAANVPVYKLLGGYRDKVLAYASSPFYPTVEQYVEEVLGYVDQGYKAYKINGTADVARDIKVARAVREAVGDRMGLMLNASGAYDHEGALKVGRALQELDFLWLQNPFPDYDIRGYAELARVLDLPIAGTEQMSSRINIVGEYILQKAVDIVRADVNIRGGITGVKKTAIAAETFGMKLEIHSGGNALMNVANLHVLCSIKNGDYHQISSPYHRTSCAVETWEGIDKEGYIHVPQKPGLGLEIDWDYIRKHLI